MHIQLGSGLLVHRLDAIACFYPCLICGAISDRCYDHEIAVALIDLYANPAKLAFGILLQLAKLQRV